MDWLGYWLTPKGLKPWKKKVNAILKLQPPQNLQQLRSFIGAVTYYHDMFPRRSDIMAPLTNLTGSKFIWTSKQQQAFDKMKAVIAHDVLLCYPDHNKPYHIFVDASDYQLGAVIIQDNEPVAFFSRKLSAAQQNYTTMEKEMLSAVECLKEFHSLIYGCPELHIYTDHKNNTMKNLTSRRVLTWRLFLEDYNPTFHYIPGNKNNIANFLSRMPTLTEEKGPGMTVSNLFPTAPKDELSEYYLLFDDTDYFECFLNLPPSTVATHMPLNFQTIHDAQLQDTELMQWLQADPANFQVQPTGFNQIPLIHHQSAHLNAWHIAIPTSLLDWMVRWYHRVLNHPGETRQYQTIACYFWHPHLDTKVQQIISTCDTCQRYKLPGIGYGELPPRTAELMPWTGLQVDNIGPWKVTLPNGNEVEFNAVTFIDPVSNLFEVARINNHTSEHLAMQLQNVWLSRYPWPRYLVHDKEGCFTAVPFQNVLHACNIDDKTITTKNPTAQGIVERVHQTIGNVLRTLLHAHTPQNMAQASDLIDTALANAMHAARATYHRSLRASPGQVVFGRDMFVDLPFVADLLTIQQQRQRLIDADLRRRNVRRHDYDYQPGQYVLLAVYNPDKLEERYIGPFRIHMVHTNGTITIERHPYVLERINIRRVKPYRY